LVEEVPETRQLFGAEPLIPDAWRHDREIMELGLRLTFSAIVDADHLDTAAHFAGLRASAVTDPADMPALLARFEAARRGALAIRVAAPVDMVRDEVYRAAMNAAAGAPGLYRLSAPAGAGKTLAAGGFALQHAAEHRKARVVVAMPFITITEQNAAVYRARLGSEVVLEDHSSVEGGDERARLCAGQNWDSPFVVTTTVQLFDSLFGRKPSRCRKVHRLANAVIVLDEVQALPMDLLLPILSVLRLLCEHFGTTVLLTSATQPSFQRLSVWNHLDGAITEVIADPVELAARLRRVHYQWRLNPRQKSAQVADEICGERQALVVMNTVGDARQMYRLLVARGAGRIIRHLSTRMCPTHRGAVLDEIRGLIDTGKPVLLVSTQLIEAGVDVDFPVVFRVLAPADSLQQAAGRANREGRNPEPGRVVIFEASDTSSPPSYRTSVAQTTLYFGPQRADPDDLAALDRYYSALYASLDLEHAQRGTTIRRNGDGLNFRSIADGPLRDPGALGADRRVRDQGLAFRMLDDDSTPVAITTTDLAARLVDELRTASGPVREVLRALQPYIVGIPTRIAERPDIRTLLAPVTGDLMQWRGKYDPAVGIDESVSVIKNPNRTLESGGMR
jgi:CRISPR-associated endonuclease/helicase Cas3